MSNAADPKAVKARNRRERREAERFLGDIQWVMSDAKGRRFMVWLLNKAALNETSFRGGNALDMAFREGMRNLGLMVQAHVLEACPAEYLLALDEVKKIQKREEDAEEAAELASTSTPEKEDDYG